MEFLNLDAVHILALLILVYLIYTVLFRLYLSPIAQIPGPKVAALTWWYEYYHDVVTYGKYIWKVQEFHQQYGPIVRISPSEVHINDPDSSTLFMLPAIPTEKTDGTGILLGWACPCVRWLVTSKGFIEGIARP
jgi:hypothetical protein